MICTAVLLIAAAFLLPVFLVYIICFYSPLGDQNNELRLPTGEQYESRRGQMTQMIRELMARPCEKVYITSKDGLRLAAKYYPGREGAPAAICFHGYRATARRDFSGGASDLIGRGYHVFLVDERAQGESGGHTMTFGIRERYDCLDWVEYVSGRLGKDVPITLHGISMGAATVLMAAGLSLPENVRAVVADSPYSAPMDIILKVSADRGLPAAVARPLVTAAASLFGRFDVTAVTAADAVRSAGIPILLIHGEDDRYVPCEMSRAIAEANPQRVRRFTFPGAGHGISYLVDKKRYQELVDAFLRESVPE